ncbi:MAG: cytochrome-c peroxidase, partial [Planctomycetaceae bacterium]
MMKAIRLTACIALGLASLALSGVQAAEKVVLGSDASLTAGIPGTGPLTVEQVTAWLGEAKNHEVLDVQLPLGLALGQAQMKGLEKNPLTRAKIELGRQLYFDTR